LKSNTSASDDGYGAAVAMSLRHAIVGAAKNDANGTSAGAVYFY